MIKFKFDLLFWVDDLPAACGRVKELSVSKGSGQSNRRSEASEGNMRLYLSWGVSRGICDNRGNSKNIRNKGENTTSNLTSVSQSPPPPPPFLPFSSKHLVSLLSAFPVMPKGRSSSTSSVSAAAASKKSALKPVKKSLKTSLNVKRNRSASPVPLKKNAPVVTPPKQNSKKVGRPATPDSSKKTAVKGGKGKKLADEPVKKQKKTNLGKAAPVIVLDDSDSEDVVILLKKTKKAAKVDAKAASKRATAVSAGTATPTKARGKSVTPIKFVAATARVPLPEDVADVVI